MSLSDTLTLSIVSHGHGALVDTLVRQLDAIEQLAEVNLIVTLNLVGEVVAFDNSAPHNLKLTIIRNRSPLGFGANHNQAFKLCTTPWFAILNPDLSITSDVFTTLIQTAYEKQAALVAPLVVNSDGEEEDSVRWNLTPWSMLKRRMRVAGEADLNDGRFRWFAGMFYVIQGNAYGQVGGFDSRYFLYCEDYDLCARLHLAGFRAVFQRDVRVIHDARRETWKSKAHFIMHLRSLLRVWFSSSVWRIALQDCFRWSR